MVDIGFTLWLSKTNQTEFQFVCEYILQPHIKSQLSYEVWYEVVQQIISRLHHGRDLLDLHILLHNVHMIYFEQFTTYENRSHIVPVSPS